MTNRSSRRSVLAGLAGAGAAAFAWPALAQDSRVQDSPLRRLLDVAPADAVSDHSRELYRFLDLAALRALGSVGATHASPSLEQSRRQGDA